MPQKSKFYVGVFNERPSYIAHSKSSMTCELFMDYRSARRRYPEVMRVQIAPIGNAIRRTEEILPRPWWEFEPSEPGEQEVARKIRLFKARCKAQWFEIKRYVKARFMRK
jgi:hypothetical protein